MLLRIALIAVVFFFTHIPAHAVIDMFLLVEGVPGESRDAAHPNQCDVLAWSWGMSNSGTVVGGGTGAGKVSIQDLSLTKYFDKASPLLMTACARGTHYPRVTLSLRKAGATATQHFMVITMEEVMVTGMSTGGSGGEDRLTENVTFNFGKVTLDYW